MSVVVVEYPGVLSVKPNTYNRVHTTRSWDFLGLSYDQPSPSGLLHKAKFGEDIIVGVIDTGIWPESRSFDDSGYGPVPKRWRGECEVGEAFNASSCNRKLIGARLFNADATADDLKGDYMSPRDANGHGTHTSSTVAGGTVRGASYRGGGLGSGLARGGAPRARLAMYKAYFASGHCGGASIVAAIDAAINDGVDVLSMSLGGTDTPGTLHAVARGISVVMSAGNAGPVPQSVENPMPWAITVAAATIDRSFPTAITIGDGLITIVGQSLYHSHAAAAASHVTIIDCNKEGLESANMTGQIVMCLARPFGEPDPFYMALKAAIPAGAKGLVLEQYNTDGIDTLEACEGRMPCAVVDKQMASVMKFASLYKISAKISPAATVVGSQVVSPIVAAFSSRGPSPLFPALLKPDIAAPGVSILAAKGDSYEIMSGTSMACPHVSAVVALLKSVHPAWSPAMIKSAIVTTASVTDRFGMPILADTVQRKLADPFDFGGGHINPDRAVDPGLVYDVHPEDYTQFFNCTLGPMESCLEEIGTSELYQLNLPSIAVPDLKGSAVTVWRTVTNVGLEEEDVSYWARAEAPAGVAMSVEPPAITFTKGGSKSATFKVTFVAKQSVQGVYTFGSLTWLDGRTHSVRIPIAVRTIIQDLVADAS